MLATSSRIALRNGGRTALKALVARGVSVPLSSASYSSLATAPPAIVGKKSSTQKVSEEGEGGCRNYTFAMTFLHQQLLILISQYSHSHRATQRYAILQRFNPIIYNKSPTNRLYQSTKIPSVAGTIPPQSTLAQPPVPKLASHLWELRAHKQSIRIKRLKNYSNMR